MAGSKEERPRSGALICVFSAGDDSSRSAELEKEDGEGPRESASLRQARYTSVMGAPGRSGHVPSQNSRHVRLRARALFVRCLSARIPALAAAAA